MTEQEKKDKLAALALHLNDLIEIATNSYKLCVAMIRGGDSGICFFQTFIPEFHDTAKKISGQNEFIQKFIQDIVTQNDKEQNQ